MQFTLLATDFDGSAQTYAAVTPLPLHAQLDPQSGQFTFTPDYSQAGNYTVTFSATDPSGLSDSITVSLQIANVDRPPTIQVSNESVLVGAALQFTVQGSDPDTGDVLTYSATGLPAGATLDPSSGAFAWTPGSGQAGTYPVVFSVSDGQLSASQTAEIHAVLSSQAPTVTLVITPSFPATPGQQVVVHATATGLASIAALSLTMNGQPVTLDAQGRYLYTAGVPGRVQFVATATDVGGQVGQATAVVKVLDPSDTVPPSVSLDPSLSGRTLTEATAINGTVIDSNLDTWTLQIALIGSGQFTTLASGTAAVAGATLASLDPGTLLNGAYLLQLVATDIAGRTSQTSATVQIDTATKAGQYLRTDNDLTVSLGGTTVSLTRVYDSLNRNQSSSFGYGWSLAVADTNLQTSVTPTGNESEGVYNPFAQGTRIYLTLPDGQRVGFTFTPQRHDQSGVTWYTPAYVADPGVTWRLDSAGAVLTRGGNGFYGAANGMPYNPASKLFSGAEYTLTAPDGTLYEIDAARGVQQEDLPGGQHLYFSGSGITSDSGAAVTFIRDAQGRITTIQAPDGTRLVYAYDAAGNLVSAHNTGTGQSDRYGYAAGDPHLLTLATAPEAGTGSAVSYGSPVQVTPIAADLGGTSQFLKADAGGQITAGATGSYTFLLTAAEVASTPTGVVYVTVEIEAGGGSSLQPAVPRIAGLTPIVGRTGAGVAFALFAIDRAGLELLQVGGASSTTAGSFTLHIAIAGDANQDGDVNGADGTMIAGLLGTASGHAGYIASADANDDGVIDAADVQLVAANYGFQPASPPVVQPATVMTHVGLPVPFDLNPQAADPQGLPVFFRIVGSTGGAAVLDPDGHTVTFTPAAGFSGTASFVFRADDGYEISAPATITVDVSTAALVSLDFQSREPRIKAGGGTVVVAVGNFADEQDVVLDPSYVRFQSTGTSVATVTAAGRLVGVAQGTSVLLVTAQGLQAATAVSVGLPQDSLGQTLYNVGINPYPLSVALSSDGGTRQFDVNPTGDVDRTTDLSTAASGTLYFVANPLVATVSPDGLLSAVAPGSTTVTIINGPAEAVIPVLVQAPQIGTVMVGPSGGVVEGQGGSIVAVPPGDLTTAASVSITPATRADLPEAVPYNMELAAAFDLNLGPDGLDVPVQLAIPVAPDIPVGSTVYFYRAGQFLNSDFTTQPIWWQVETGVVDADHVAHTHSPPQLGVGNSGLYLLAYSQQALDDFEIDRARDQLDTALKGVATLALDIAEAAAGGELVGVEAAVDAIGIVASLAMPSTPLPTPVEISLLTPVAPPFIQTYNVQLVPGQVTRFTSPIVLPPVPPINAPEVTSVALADIQQGQKQPEITITGSGFLTSTDGPVDPTKLEVSFQQPNGASFKSQPLGSPSDTSLTVPVPDGVAVGVSNITVMRPDPIVTINPKSPNGFTQGDVQYIPSNPAQINPSAGGYVFVALPEANNGSGALAVLDGNSVDTGGGTTAIPGTFGSVTAEIPLGLGEATPYPSNVAVTPDNTRAYVTLEGTGQVAEVDAITLQEVNVHAGDPTAAAVKAPIPAPDGAALDPALRLAEISGPTDLRGTISLPNLDHWTLELAKWQADFVPILTVGGGTTPLDSAKLATFDPAGSGIADGFYRLRLTAYAKDNSTTIDEIYVGVDANPRSKEIDLPIGAEPVGIAIDPGGNYAYVADARPYRADQHSTDGNDYVPSQRVSQVYLIDINPASPTYDQVVETIQLVTSGTLSDGTPPQLADPNGLIAPDGLRQIAVTPDGMQLDVAAPNLNSNPTGGPFADLPGNLIQITLAPRGNFQPPAVKGIVAIPAGDGTFGVAVEPYDVAAQAALKSGRPIQYQVAFTNANQDSIGLEVTHPADGTKATLPLDLDPNDLDPSSPLRQYVQANSQYSNCAMAAGPQCRRRRLHARRPVCLRRRAGRSGDDRHRRRGHRRHRHRRRDHRLSRPGVEPPLRGRQRRDRQEPAGRSLRPQPGPAPDGRRGHATHPLRLPGRPGPLAPRRQRPAIPLRQLPGPAHVHRRFRADDLRQRRRVHLQRHGDDQLGRDAPEDAAIEPGARSGPGRRCRRVGGPPHARAQHGDRRPGGLPVELPVHRPEGLGRSQHPGLRHPRRPEVRADRPRRLPGRHRDRGAQLRAARQPPGSRAPRNPPSSGPSTPPTRTSYRTRSTSARSRPARACSRPTATRPTPADTTSTRTRTGS